MATEKPEKPHRRRWLKIVTGAALVLVLVAAGLIAALLYRDELAQALLQDELEDLGLGGVQFHIEHLSPRVFTMVNFSAGGALSFDRLSVKYSPEDILDGRVDSVELVGLEVDLTQPEPWGRIRERMDEEGDGGPAEPFDLSLLPLISVEGAKLLVASPTGPVTVTVSTTLQPKTKDSLAAKLTATTVGAPGAVDVAYDGTAIRGVDFIRVVP